jgi:hypothetical protein
VGQPIFTTQPISLICGQRYVGSESNDKEGAGPKSRAKYHAEYHEGKGTYTAKGKVPTPI